MANLTQQQELFAQTYVDCGNASEAYRVAYPKSQKWKQEALWGAASTLLKNSKVVVRVEELKAELSKKFLWTREQSVKALVRVVKSPDKTSDIVLAVKELNSMHGYNEPTKHEHTGADGSPLLSFFNVEFVSPKN